MVKSAKTSEKHESTDSATLKTKGTKQAGDKTTSKIVKQQASFMKKTAAAPLSYLMGSLKINGGMGSMQADVFSS